VYKYGQTRRDFLKTTAAGVLGLTTPVWALPSRLQASGFFAVHPFIENHPEAVFIMPTHVDHMLNDEAKKEAGHAFGRSVFIPGSEGGIPLDISIPVKMNLKTTGAGKFPLEDILGCVTDPFFAEGVYESIQELGISGNQIHVRENPRGTSFETYGIPGMAERCGIDFRNDFNGTVGNGMEAGRDFNWTKVPDGVFFKEIPHLEPINTPGTWLLNMGKFKAHGMGLTLCSKNLQGMMTRPFCRLCARIDSDMGLPSHVRDTALKAIQTSYNRHVAESIIPRWDKPGQNGGSWQEVWTHRTLDNLSVTPCGLNIIEGIYGHDGDGGNNGPHMVDGAEKTKKVTTKDFLSNYIIFGKDIFRTDIIGHLLGGHEPGNFGYFHLAIERGMSDALDPQKIPVYLWENGTATLMPVTEFTRTPLRTYYLQRDYKGQNEPRYHLCDEPFDYSCVDGISSLVLPERPEAFVLNQIKISPSNPHISIEYWLPNSGNVRFEIYSANGRMLDVPVDGYRKAGAHMAVWDTRNTASGTYTYRLRSTAFEKRDKLVLLK